MSLRIIVRFELEVTKTPKDLSFNNIVLSLWQYINRTNRLKTALNKLPLKKQRKTKKQKMLQPKK